MMEENLFAFAVGMVVAMNGRQMLIDIFERRWVWAASWAGSIGVLLYVTFALEVSA